MDKARVSRHYSLRAIAKRSYEAVLHEPLEPVLHPSRTRLRWLGVFTMVGHPLFAWIWGSWLRQPYENLGLRLVATLLGALLVALSFVRDTSSRLVHVVYTTVFWLQLPVLFTWMYLSNGGNSVWLASLCAAILIQYHVTDWRLATVGLVTGVSVSWILFQATGSHVASLMPEQAATNIVVIVFSWCCALLLGISSANLRREHLNNTLTTIGIMAHELRTPLSTAGLISDALQMQAETAENEDSAKRLAKLAERLRALTHNMNHQIDTQISNARLMQLPGDGDLIAAGDLVRQVVSNYPYRSSRERQCIVVTVHRDFRFRSSLTQFSQVLDNLIKNALHSLQTASSAFSEGDLQIEVGASGTKGRIVVIDKGMGINPKSLPHIFEAFFSTNRGTGHGLGLAFCKRVVETARGRLSVKSVPLQGATFIIELPVQVQVSNTHQGDTNS